MGKIFEKADEEVMGRVRDMIDKNHPDLHECEVRVGVVMVTADKDEMGAPKAPAVKFGGAAAYAVVRKVSAKDRVHKPFDALIEIDADKWADLKPASRDALIDHELEHVQVLRDDAGAIVTTDDLRPKLKLKPDDWVMTGFRCIVDRHGKAALEYQGLERLHDIHGQALFPWAKSDSKKPGKGRAAA